MGGFFPHGGGWARQGNCGETHFCIFPGRGLTLRPRPVYSLPMSMRLCVCVRERVSFCVKGQCIRDSRAINRLVLGEFPSDPVA